MMTASWRGASTLVGGFLLHITLGTLYTIGNLNPYLVSYLRGVACKSKYKSCTATTASGEFLPGNADMVWVMSCATIGQAGAMFFGGLLSKRVGAPRAALTGGAIASMGVALAAPALRAGSFVGVVLSAGLLFGVGVGIAYAPPLELAMRWFPRTKGLANGIVVGGFGLGALIFDRIQTETVNAADTEPHKGLYPLIDPAERYFTKEEVERLPGLMVSLATTYFAMQALAVVLMHAPPVQPPSSSAPRAAPSVAHAHHSGVPQSDRKDEDAGDISGVSESHGLLGGGTTIEMRTRTHSDVGHHGKSGNGNYAAQNAKARMPWRGESVTVMGGSQKQVFSSRTFWILWFAFFLNSFAVSFTASLFKAYGQDRGISDRFIGAFVGPTASLCNCAARVFWGRLGDLIGFGRTVFVMQMLMAILMSTWTLTDTNAAGHFTAAVPTSQGANRELYAVWVCAIFFCVGGNFSLFPAATARAFGVAHTAQNYGLVFTSIIPSSLIAGLLTAPLKERLGWGLTTTVVAAVSLLGGVVGWRFQAESQKAPPPASAGAV